LLPLGLPRHSSGCEQGLVGLSVAAMHQKRADADYVALAALGPSAAAFAEAVERAPSQFK
jgi:hypothetical protein